MPTDGTIEYYTDRKRSAVAMSQAASEPAISRIHLQLARRYAALAGEPDTVVESRDGQPVGMMFAGGTSPRRTERE